MSAPLRSGVIVGLLLAASAAEAAPRGKRSHKATAPAAKPSAPAAKPSAPAAKAPAPAEASPREPEARHEPAPPPRAARPSRAAPPSARAAATLEQPALRAAPPPSRARRGPNPTAFVLSLGMHSDDGGRRGHRRVSALPGAIDDDLANESRLYGSLAFLKAVGDRLRVGGGLRYYGSWDYKLEGENNNNNAPVEELGTLVELVGLAEGRFAMTSVLDLLLGGGLGFGVLFPGGTLEDEIKQNQDNGLSSWNVPRLGYLVEGQVGGRYRILERVYTRLDFGLGWSQTFLHFTSGRVGPIDVDHKERVNIVRYRFSAALEVAL